MKHTLENLGYLHDYTCFRVNVFEDGIIEMDCRYYDTGRYVQLRFEGVVEFEFNDLALGNVFDYVRETAFALFEKEGLFPVRNKNTVRSFLDCLEKSEKKHAYCLWTIGSSYGLNAAILGERLLITSNSCQGGPPSEAEGQ